MPPAVFERHYAAADGEYWSRADLRSDQRLVLRRIEAETEGRSVLDIGCYDGALLAATSARWQRFGIEPSTAASRTARELGVQILAPSLEGLDLADGADDPETPLPPGAARFDVVCAVDVVEHVPDPAALMARMARRLSPGGLLIVSTGDLDARSWRATGGSYWYCSFPEHISFLSEGWLRGWADARAMRLEAVERFAYDGEVAPRSRFRFWRRALERRLKIGRSRRPGVRVLGTPGLFADHLMAVLRRPAA